MTFKLSSRSEARLVGIKPQLERVVRTAITLTKVDFGVTCGLRTVAEQRELVAKGASQTMNSKHLTGDAVDLVAYVGPNISWNLKLYDDIADAMKAAAIKENVGICWGAAWTVPDIRFFEGTMEEAMLSYVDNRRKAGRRPFIDGPHFQLA
jgi:peptidoglycan LD-endopeptidase CwlK